MTHAFDTMAFAEDLERRGFKASAAKALAETTRDHVVNRVATKGDLDTVSREIRADLKLWIGGSLIASIVSTAAIASLIISVIK